jgi:hypothetical protein
MFFHGFKVHATLGKVHTTFDKVHETLSKLHIILVSLIGEGRAPFTNQVLQLYFVGLVDYHRSFHNFDCCSYLWFMQVVTCS